VTVVFVEAEQIGQGQASPQEKEKSGRGGTPALWQMTAMRSSGAVKVLQAHVTADDSPVPYDCQKWHTAQVVSRVPSRMYALDAHG